MLENGDMHVIQIAVNIRPEPTGCIGSEKEILANNSSSEIPMAVAGAHFQSILDVVPVLKLLETLDLGRLD